MASIWADKQILMPHPRGNSINIEASDCHHHIESEDTRPSDLWAMRRRTRTAPTSMTTVQMATIWLRRATPKEVPICWGRCPCTRSHRPGSRAARERRLPMRSEAPAGRRLTWRAQRQLSQSVREPPSSRPTAAPSPAVAPKTAKIRSRSRRRVNTTLMAARLVGPRSAAKTPWTTRAATSTGKEGARPATRPATTIVSFLRVCRMMLRSRASGGHASPSRRSRSSMVSGRSTQPCLPPSTQATPGRVNRL